MTGHSRSLRTVPFLPQGTGAALRRHTIEAAAAALAGIGLVGLAALVTYSSGDPSWNTASPLPPANLVGGAGAWLADAGFDPQRLRLADALRGVRNDWIQHMRTGGPSSPPTAPEPLVNPVRPGRIEPRLTKRRPDQQRYLTVPRTKARQRLLRQQLAA